MKEPTKEDITCAVRELQEAMLESFEASHAVDAAKQRKEKAHYRLLHAQEEIRAFNRTL